MEELRKKYKEIVVWGDGAALFKHSSWLEKVDYIVDSRVKTGEVETSKWDLQIYSPSVLHGKDDILIIISSRRYFEEISNEIKEIAPKAEIMYASEVFVHKAAYYGQHGEDAIIDSIFKHQKIINITYCEVGVPYPIDISNTYKFYQNSKEGGVLVEANPMVYDELKRVRPRDKVICCGCSSCADENKELDFYIIKDHPGLNTFSKEAVDVLNKKGFECEHVIKVPMLSLNSIFERNFSSAPTLVSVDIEGLEYYVLKDFDFDKWHCYCFCIEKGDNNVLKLMNEKGYSVIAETPGNWIFVIKEWMKDFELTLS